MPSSTRMQIDPWPSGDLGDTDPLTPRIVRTVMSNASHLVDSQCQCLVTWVATSGVFRIAAASATPQLVWRTRVPLTIRPDGRFALWVVQLLVSSAAAGAVVWKIGARRGLGAIRSSAEVATTDASATINSTTAVWTSPLLVRPDIRTTPDPIATSAAVGTATPTTVVVDQRWAQLGIWASGAVVPRLHGVCVREFGGT